MVYRLILCLEFFVCFSLYLPAVKAPHTMRQLKQMFWVKGAIEKERERHKHLVCVMLCSEATKTSSIKCVFINSPQPGTSFNQNKLTNSVQHQLAHKTSKVNLFHLPDLSVVKFYRP